MDRSSPTEEDWPQEGTFCTLKLLKKADGTELQRYPVDGERTTFGRDPSNDVRIYYPDISRFQCELVFNSDRKPFLKVLGKTGVLINGKQTKPPAEVELKEGDTFEMRKKRWLLCLPSDGAVQAMKQVEVSTPRRRRPSTRFSIIPPDLAFSPYAAHDAAARLPASPIGSLMGPGTPSSTQLMRRQEPSRHSSQDIEQEEEEGDGQDDSSGENEEEEQASEEGFKVGEPASKSIATRIQESIWMPRRFSNPLSNKDKDIDGTQTVKSVLQPSKSDGYLNSIVGRKRKSQDEQQDTQGVSHQQTTPRSIPLPISSETPYAPADGTPVRKPLINKTPSSTAGRTPHSSAKNISNNRSSLYPALPPTPISYRTAQSSDNSSPSTSVAKGRPDERPLERDLATPDSTETSADRSPEVHTVPLPSPKSLSVQQTAAPSTPNAVVQQTPKHLTSTRGPNSLRKAILMRSARKVLFGQKEEPVVVKDEMIGNVKIRRRSSAGSSNQDVFDDSTTEPVSSIFNFEPDSESSNEEEEEEEDVDKENLSTEGTVLATTQQASNGIENEEHFYESDGEDLAESNGEESSDDEDLSDEDLHDGRLDDGKMGNYADQEVSIDSVDASESDDEAFEEIEKSLILEISSGSESEEDEKPDMKPFIVKKEETSLDDIVPAGPSIPTLLSTPQAARPVQTRFYTPQAVSSADFKVNLSRTMGPPVLVPASASKPRSLNPLSKVWKEEAGRRSSLGPPLRVHRVRTVEEDVEEEIKDEQDALRKAATKRRESAIILASAPRQLPKISEFDIKDLQSPRKKPLMTPTAISDLNDSSSDEERTPLQLLAKKAEKLRKRTMARQSISSTTPFSPSAPGTPLRNSALLTSTPKSLLNHSSVPLFESPNSQPSRFSARPEPPTPNMGGLRHLFSTSTAAPSTPRFGGMKSLFKEPIAESPSTPHLGGIESMFQSSEETTSLIPESPSVARPLRFRDEPAPQAEEPSAQEVMTERPDESLLVLLEDSLLDLDQVEHNDISGAVTDHEGPHVEDDENDEDERELQNEHDQVFVQASQNHLIGIQSITTLSSAVTSTVTTTAQQDVESTDVESSRVKTRQTSAQSTATTASEVESVVDSIGTDVASPSPPAPPSPPRTRRATSRAASEQPTTTQPVPVSKLPARRTARVASATPSVTSSQASVRSTRSTGTVKKEPSARTIMDRDESELEEQPMKSSNRRAASVSTRASQEPMASDSASLKPRRGRVPISSTAEVTTAISGFKGVKTEPIELETLEEDDDVLEIEAPPAPSSSRAVGSKARMTATATTGKKAIGSGAAISEPRSIRDDGSSLPVIKKRRTATDSSVEDDKENESAKSSNRPANNASNTTAGVRSIPASKLIPPKPIGRTTRARTATAEPEEQNSGKHTIARVSARSKK